MVAAVIPVREEATLMVDGSTALISLPIKSWTVNDERRVHWRESRGWTKELREAAGLILRREARRHDLFPYAGPVTITVTSYGLRCDTGNDYPAAKAAIDALVDVGILHGDTPKYVGRIVMNAPRSGPARLVLCVEPHGE